MIAALVPLVLCGLTFVEQDIPDVALYGVDYYSGRCHSNFLRADFDGDGTLDLLLPTYLAFQRGNGFGKTQIAPIPDFGESPQCDVWGRDLYLCLSNRIEVIRWDGTQWKRILSQQLEWPPDCRFRAFGETEPDADSRALRFQSFLNDLDADGKPEIIVPARDAVHVYRQKGLFFENAAQWNVYPPIRVLRLHTEPIWPARNRTIRTLDTGWDCELYVSGPDVVTVVSENQSSSMFSYRFVHRRLTFDGGFAVLGEPESPKVYTVPSGTLRCRLNEDDVPDFVQYVCGRSNAGPIPFPMQTITVSTNGGTSWTTVRSMVSSQQRLFVDVNGDKRLDLIAESSGLYQGGLRELTVSFLTGRTIRHTVNVVPQQADGTFVQGQATRFACSVQIDAPPIQNSPMFRAYQFGQLLDVSGDFTGDGLLDLAVHEAPERIAIYPNTGSGLASASCATLATRPDWAFAVGDVDGDKRADIVLSISESGGEETQTNAASRLFLSREGAP